ncbi:hypothetical protein BV898_09187 [Hypsibius exemplaris]|uniref:HIG1 domain-containing protein n=1 Tax=Hypsibius exemplaris TaxID=2072580 RepID=A0A1W0WN84_HYPEX|nr:hypothetical protein BV898_09187 [Hypsibius exemplaris]
MAQAKDLTKLSRDQTNLTEELQWVRKGPAHPEHGAYVSYVQPETFREKAYRKTMANPLVPIGILTTTMVLGYGLWCMRKGNQQMSQYMMRARVAAQAFTIIALVGGVYVAGSRAK